MLASQETRCQDRQLGDSRAKQNLLAVFESETLRDKRDYAIVAVLLGCGLRRAELAAASVQELQKREDHWVFADLIGKGGHIRTVPIPDWVGNALQAWTSEAAITTGPIFRAINKAGRIPSHGFTPKVIWEVVKRAASTCGLSNVAPHDLRRYAESKTMPNEVTGCTAAMPFGPA
jgi:integrase